MEVKPKESSSGEHETLHKADVLRELEPVVDDLMNQHVAKRKLWMPSEFLPADERTEEDDERFHEKLRERARGIEDPVRVSLVMNLLTEEGLPHFHRLLSTYLGHKSVWKKWNNLWTAEEDRHGAIIRDYARDTRLFNFREVEEMQYDYQEAGFDPDWDSDPYKVFVYTTLQERATQISHQNTGRMVGREEPVLFKILTNVGADEAKHYAFYRQIFNSLLEIDPNRALHSASEILPSIDMPGINMPNFKKMAEIIRRIGIYGPWDYKDIVEEVIAYWDIENLTGLNELGRKAQEKILGIPGRLEKVAKYIESKTGKKAYSFEFLYNRRLAME